MRPSRACRGRGLLLGLVVGWGILVTGIWYLYPVNNQVSSLSRALSYQLVSRSRGPDLPGGGAEFRIPRAR